MKYTFTSNEVAEVLAALKTEKNIIVKERLQAISMIMHNGKYDDIAKQMNRTRFFIHTWVKNYKESGLERLALTLTHGYDEKSVQYIEYDNDKFLFVKSSMREIQTYSFKDVEALILSRFTSDLIILNSEELKFNRSRFSSGEMYLFIEKLKSMAKEI